MSTHQKRKVSKRRGATIIEVVTASSIGTLVMFSAVMSMISGFGSWAKGQGKINADSDSQRALRSISMELRQAMSVTVASDGMSLDYRLPQLDSNGNYIIPVVWDGVSRRIEYADGTIRVRYGDHYRTLAKNVITTDPRSTGGSTPYRIFTAGAGSITRQLTVMLAIQTNGARNQTVSSRVRESVYLRNIPSLTK